MIGRATLARWARAHESPERYLRPFVARGPLAKQQAVVVGLNPATIIRPDDVAPETYVDLLLDMEQFSVFYQRLRRLRGKPAVSRTRQGLDNIATWLQSLRFTSVVETNVSPYPTEKGQQLDHVHRDMQARHVLPDLLKQLAPRLLLLHGEDACSAIRKMPIGTDLVMGRTFTDTVTRQPQLGQVTWSDGSQGDVFACPHLRFFGRSGGKRFAPLKARLCEWDR